MSVEAIPTPERRIENLRRISIDDTVNNFARAICAEAASYLDAALKAAQPQERNAVQEFVTYAVNAVSNDFNAKQPERVSVPMLCPENMLPCDRGCAGGWCVTMFGSPAAAQEGK